MPGNQQHYTAIGRPTPFVLAPIPNDLFHWDGAFFAVLCLASWIWFACLWVKIRLTKRPQLPPPLPPLKVENFVGSHHWRN
jgi:hypothetical protein